MRLRLHYAWIVALVTFAVLLVTAGIRATPGVLMISLEGEFGWSRAVISGAVAINIALFGLIGPFAASVMDRWGLRRVVLAAIALLGIAVALTTRMQSQWHLTLLWGVLVGTGTGVTSMVLAAIVANRWFDERRGLVLAFCRPPTPPVSWCSCRYSHRWLPRAAGGLPPCWSLAPP
jgi:MFS family permease